MLTDEFPHVVTFKKLTLTSDGGGGSVESWTDYATIYAFMDTPSSVERFEAAKANHILDRYLYFPYRTDITPDMRVSFEGELYKAANRAEDQGGQHEIMRLSLELVPNG